MSGPEFFQTRMGAIFYESTMPAIAKALEAIAKRPGPAVADRAALLSMMAATIGSGLASREKVAPFREGEAVAEKAVEIAFHIEKLIATKIGAGQ